MSDTRILYPEKVVDLDLKTVAAVVYSAGDLVGYSTGWVKADADAATNVYAQYILLQGGKGGERVKACQKCLLENDSATWTANTAQYLSGTAGGTTETRPATNGDMIHIVGRSLDTKHCLIDIQAPKEFEMFIPPDNYDTTGETGLGTVDTGWTGKQIDAAGELVFFTGRLPSGLVGSIVSAKILYNSINGSALDQDVTIVATYDGGANNAATGAAITAGDWTQVDADNIMYTQDIASLFDATVWLPRMTFCVKTDPDGITADAQVIGLVIRGFKV